MQIISISNHKGGVAKTTTTASLGAALALNHKKVLLIDLDPQANLSQSFGIKDAQPSIYEALKGSSLLPVIEINTNLSLCPANLNLSGAELEFSMEPGRESLLKSLLNKLPEKYDYVLIDCAPSLGLLTINALNCSDQVLIPLQAQFLASQGLNKLLQIISKVKERLNPNLKVGGIVITMYKKRTVLSRDIIEFSNKNFSDLMFSTKIRDNIALAEAPAVGQDIFRYAPDSPGAQDYAQLCIEFLNRV